jgi:Icc-related predicted phosphoesterase
MLDLSAKNPNFHVLIGGNHKTINGQRYVGGTMWFRDDSHNKQFSKYLSDFSQIKKFVPWVYEQNEREVKNLRANVCNTDIVITHHMPTYKAVHPIYVGDSLNRFFVCDVEDIITAAQPKLWVFGHTHHPFDFNIGQTRLYCNPLGYPSEGTNPTFDARLRINI